MGGEARVIIKQNEYMRKFRNARALDATTARRPDELTIEPDRIFRQMLGKDVFRPGRAPGTYYMDPSAAEGFVEARRRRAFYIMLLILIVAALMFFLGRR